MSVLESGSLPLLGSATGRFQATSQKVLRTILFGLDAVLIIVATLAAIALRDALPWPNVAEVGANVAPVVPLVPVGWMILLAVLGSYNYKYLGTGMAEYQRVFSASVVLMAALGVGAYLFEYDLSRGFFVLLFAVGAPLLLTGRFVMRRLINAARRKGLLATRTILAGRAGHVEELLKILSRERWLGYQVEGLLLPYDSENPSAGELPVLGTPEDAVEVIRRTGASAVIFADGSFECASDFNLLARDLEDVDAQTIVVPALSNISAGRMQTRPVAGIPLVFVERPHAVNAMSWSKRAFDILGSAGILLVLSPVLLITALAIYLNDRGPVLFRQPRVGRHGELFDCLKLRSMVVNAAEMTKELQARSNGNGVLFKMVDDPRITKIGKFIRRYSIDELPQLINVLKGDMSLIGPRPALPSEVDLYEDHVLRRLAVRPGMTGLWQVSGRSNLSWEDTVRLDLYYVDNWSMMQDMTILARTFGAVVSPNGAY